LIEEEKGDFDKLKVPKEKPKKVKRQISDNQINHSKLVRQIEEKLGTMMIYFNSAIII